MSRNSSVAVLAECTDLYNSHVSLMGLNGSSSVLSIENETVLTNNTDISPHQVIGSMSFQERVQSTDLAALFPRGILNQKRKKKKKSNESSLSSSESSENMSSLQSNINVTESNENLSASFEGCSQKMENIEESIKPFNKRLYLKKKSVNISFDANSLSNSIPEKNHKRSRRVVNVSLDPKIDENASDSFEGSRKFEMEEKSSKVFNKRSYLKKKSVNISFDAGSLNNSLAEKSLENSPVTNVSLPSKRRNASRRRKLNCGLNIDDLESADCSEENLTNKQTKSIRSSVKISCNELNKELNESQPMSPEGDSSDDNGSKSIINVIESNGNVSATFEGCSQKMENKEESAKPFNKHSYLKKKSVKISFDASSLNNSLFEKNHTSYSRVVNASLDPKIDENVLDSFEGSRKLKMEEESPKVFNKCSYLKKKSINISFGSSSLNNSLGDRNLENTPVTNEQSADCSEENFTTKETKSIPSSVSISHNEINEESIKSQPKSSEGDSSDDNRSNDSSKIETHLSLTNNSVHSPNDGSNSLGSDREQNDKEAMSKNSVMKFSNGSTEFIPVEIRNDTVDDLSNLNNGSKSSEIGNAAVEYVEKNINVPESIENVSASIETCSQEMENKEESPKPFNKHLYLKKKSVNMSFDASSLKNSISEKSNTMNSRVVNVSLDPKIDDNVSDSFDASRKFEIEEESLKAFNKHSYLKKKSVNISFSSSSLNNSICEKNHATTSRVVNVSLDPKIDEDVSDSFEGCSQKMENKEESAKLFNKHSYLKKKSVKISFEASSLNNSICEKNHTTNSCVINASLDPKMHENVSDSFEGSRKFEMEEESPKVFNKCSYLKKKSINISFGSSSLNNSLGDRNLEDTPLTNEQSADCSEENFITEETKSIPSSVSISRNEINEESNKSPPKPSEGDSFADNRSNDSSKIETHLSLTNNSVHSPSHGSNSLGSDREQIDEEVMSRNLVMKKSKDGSTEFIPVEIRDDTPDDLSNLNDVSKPSEIDNAAVECVEKNINVTESNENVSASYETFSQQMENKEESTEPFNKHLYLKKKSVKISFDASSLNNSLSEKSNTTNSRVVNVSLDPKIDENESDSFEGSRKFKMEEESLKAFNKRSYLKKKSINISFGSSSLNNSMDDISLESSPISNVSLHVTNEHSDDNSEENFITKKTKSIPSSVTISHNEINEESNKCQSKLPEGDSLDNTVRIPGHGSNSLGSTIERNDEVVSINLVIKKSKNDCKEFIPVKINGDTVDDPSNVNNVSKSSENDNAAIVDVEKNIDVIESNENVSACFEGGSQKMENKEESAKLFNKHLYLKKKSVKFTFDASSLNNSISEKNDTRNSRVVEALDLKLNENVSDSFEGSRKFEVDKESPKVFKKCSYLKKKSVNISFGSSTLNNTLGDKSLENSPLTNEPSAECSEENFITKKTKSIPSSVTISCYEINECQPKSSEEDNSDDSMSKDSSKNEDCLHIIDNSMRISGHGSNSLGIDLEQNDEEVMSRNVVMKKSKDGSAEFIAVEIRDDTPDDLSNLNNVSKPSEIDNAANVDVEKNKSAAEIEMHTKILTKNSSKVLKVSSVVEDNSDGNLKSISTSMGIPSDRAPEKSNESKPKSSEENCFEEIACKDNKTVTGNHSGITEVSECFSAYESNANINSEGSNQEQIEEADLSKSSKSRCSNLTLKKEDGNSRKKKQKDENELMELNDLSKDNITESNISNSCENDNDAICDEEKSKSPTGNDIHTNILSNNLLNVRDKRVAEQDFAEGDSRRKKAKSIQSFIKVSSSQINEGSKESQPISREEMSFDENTSEENNKIKGNHPDITTVSECCLASASKSKPNINSEGNSDLGRIEELVSSKSFKSRRSGSAIKNRNRNSIKKNKKDENMELSDVQNNNGYVNDLSHGNATGCNISNSSNINNNSAVEDEQNKLSAGNLVDTNILSNNPSEILDKNSVKSITESVSIPCSQKDEESNESQPNLAEKDGSNVNTSKGNETIEDMSIPENSEHHTVHVLKKNLDMRMSVGLSVICNDNKKMSETHNVKNICHSTPLLKYQKNNVTSKMHRVSEEVDRDSRPVFACPDVPARNLRERSIKESSNISKRSRKDTQNHSDNLENSAQRNKTSPGNRTEDFIEDISIIPNPKPFTRSRVMYHSTPISKTFRKNRSKLKSSSNIKMENKNIQQDDKMIQVSKSIFGSSTEVTNGTVSKKKSIEFPNNSSPYNEKIDNRTKRKSDSYHTGMKKVPKMESIAESRSYHSNFISTLEDDSSYCTTRKSVKRVAFKSISSYENSTSGYVNSSEVYTSRNRKSVGFRDAISLIEDTIGNSSEGDIRDANNSNLVLVNPNSIVINDTPDTVNDSKSRIDRTDLSLNYSAEVPEVILTENEIECNETSKQCSLFNKLIEMAENKKSDRNMTTRQTKLSRGRKKKGSSNLATSDLAHEKWVSPNLIKYLNNKLMSDELDHVINTERIVSILCSAVSAVKNLQDVNDIDFALLPLKHILLKFRVCSSMIEYCTFISRFTPFEFQRKALPLGGYFGSYKRYNKWKLLDPILIETEKMNEFL